MALEAIVALCQAFGGISIKVSSNRRIDEKGGRSCQQDACEKVKFHFVSFRDG
jgi:hypothetical protein